VEADNDQMETEAEERNATGIKTTVEGAGSGNAEIPAQGNVPSDPQRQDWFDVVSADDTAIKATTPESDAVPQHSSETSDVRAESATSGPVEGSGLLTTSVPDPNATPAGEQDVAGGSEVDDTTVTEILARTLQQSSMQQQATAATAIPEGDVRGERTPEPELTKTMPQGSTHGGLIDYLAKAQQALAGLPAHATAAAGKMLIALESESMESPMESEPSTSTRKRMASTDHPDSQCGSGSGDDTETELSWDYGDDKACAGHSVRTGSKRGGGKVTLKPMPVTDARSDTATKKTSGKPRTSLLPPAPVRPPAATAGRGRGKVGPTRRGK